MVKHSFTLGAHEGSNLSITPRIARCIEETLNALDEELSVVKLPMNQYKDTYLVQMGIHSESLLEELRKGTIAHIAHISFKCDGIPNIIGVWKKIGFSEILK